MWTATGSLAMSAVAVAAVIAAAGWIAWRRWWFFRDPPRTPPDAPGLLSPADGRVVYVRRVAPGEPVVTIKQGLAATLTDLVREDLADPRIVIGIFMSPLDVHYNRAPLDARVESINRHPGQGRNVHMGPMHWRLLLRRPPYHRNSEHIVRNERTVTRFLGRYRGIDLPMYVVQIGAKTVNGIDSYVPVGEEVRRGDKFGMIRIGSQVDLVIPDRSTFDVLVTPGQRVRGGETVLVR